MFQLTNTTRLVAICAASILCSPAVDAKDGQEGRPERGQGPPPHSEGRGRPDHAGKHGPPPHAEGRGRPDHVRQRDAMIRRLRETADTDGDGDISEAERAAMEKRAKAMRKRSHKEILKRFDKDGDGKLSDEEKQAARDHAKKRRQQMRKRIVEKFDEDGDGKLSDAELQNARAAMKKRLSQERARNRGGNGERPPYRDDGFAPPSDKAPPHPRGGERKKMHERFDLNQDGELDENERAAMKAAREQHHAERQKVNETSTPKDTSNE